MSTEIAVIEGVRSSERFEVSLQAEEAAERDLMRSLIKAVLIAVPISITFFLLLVGIAIGGKSDWYVWVSLAVGLGTLGGLLLGALGGATLNAHKLDDVDRAA